MYQPLNVGSKIFNPLFIKKKKKKKKKEEKKKKITLRLENKQRFYKNVQINDINTFSTYCIVCAFCKSLKYHKLFSFHVLILVKVMKHFASPQDIFIDSLW